jgi:hypothetical protein
MESGMDFFMSLFPSVRRLLLPFPLHRTAGSIESADRSAQRKRLQAVHVGA